MHSQLKGFDWDSGEIKIKNICSAFRHLNQGFDLHRSFGFCLLPIRVGVVLTLVVLVLNLLHSHFTLLKRSDITLEMFLHKQTNKNM